ncbi:hypothetical protein [Aureimonas glaciei]|nr:hypothetical protein [Aureimonas glaciei]
MKLFCDTCQNIGSIDCHCGGDLCVCGEPEIDCPSCGGDVPYDEVDDDGTEPPLPPISSACPFCRTDSAFVERDDFSTASVVCNGCGARGPNEGEEDGVDEETPGARAAVIKWNDNASVEVIALKAELSRIAEMARDVLKQLEGRFDFDEVHTVMQGVLEAADEALAVRH